jgi:hypothetical protein
MKRLLYAAIVAALASVALVAQGGIGPIGMLQGRVDSNNALVVTAAAAGTTGAAVSPIANLPGKVDSSNNLIVAIAGGAINPISSITFTNGTALADTSGSGKLLLTGTTPMIQLGGTSASFPALKQNGTTMEVRTASDSGYSGLVADQVQSVTAFNGGAYRFGSNTFASATAPSSPSSCGTSPAVTTANGTVSFVVTGGTGGAATGCTVTMPAASTGWNCSITNITQTAAHRADRATVQTASTTTSVTWEYVTVSTGAATAFTASDVFRGICFGY